MQNALRKSGNAITIPSVPITLKHISGVFKAFFGHSQLHFKLRKFKPDGQRYQTIPIAVTNFLVQFLPLGGMKNLSTDLKLT